MKSIVNTHAHTLTLAVRRFILEGLLRHSADMPTLGVLAKTLVRRWARAVQVCGWVHTGVCVLCVCGCVCVDGYIRVCLCVWMGGVFVCVRVCVFVCARENMVVCVRVCVRETKPGCARGCVCGCVRLSPCVCVCVCEKLW